VTLWVGDAKCVRCGCFGSAFAVIGFDWKEYMGKREGGGCAGFGA